MSSRDDYEKLAEAIDNEFSDAFVSIDSSGVGKTLVVELDTAETTSQDVKEWITDSHNIRNVFGFGANHITINTEIPMRSRILISIE